MRPASGANCGSDSALGKREVRFESDTAPATVSLFKRKLLRTSESDTGLKQTMLSLCGDDNDAAEGSSVVGFLPRHTARYFLSLPHEILFSSRNY